MKNRYLFKVGFACALLCASVVYTSCGDDDDPTPSNQNTSGTQNPTGGDENPSGGNNNQQTGGNENENPNKPSDEVTLVSELKCTVDEFATKYTTLKKGEKVTVTLTDVSDANIAKVSETLKKMQSASLQKAGEAKYIVTLILESVQNALKTIPADTFKGVEVLREVVIPACVEAIQSDAFAECVNLVSAKILGADTKVDEKAFESANEEIKVEQTQKEVVEIKLLSPADIVPYVNASDEEIVTLNMPLETYDHTDVMMAIGKITDKKVKLVIPEGVKEFGIDWQKLKMDGNFIMVPHPSALVDVVIPESVETIGESAFYACISLTNITIPESVTTIGSEVFRGCYSLTSIIIPEGVTEIGNQAFYNCYSLTSITIPESVTTIGSEAFIYCSSLTSITIPESVTMIGNDAFFDCSSLTSITIPEGVTTIGDGAFCICSSLTSITIPEGVETIGYMAFACCSSLTSITIPESVTSIGDYAFDDCDNLETIYCSQAIYDEYHETYPQMVVKQ